jgi:hypothetical protein
LDQLRGSLAIYDSNTPNPPWDINHKDVHGMTCLHCAVCFPTSSTYIKQNKKAKSTFEEFWYGFSVILLLSCRARKEKICETLLLNKETLRLDINAKDKDGNTVLHHLFQSSQIIAEETKTSPFSSSFINLIALALRKGISTE